MFSKSNPKRSLNILIALAVVVVVAGIFKVIYFAGPPKLAAAPTPNPATMTADQVIVPDTNPSSPAPAGFRAVQDILLNVTFDMPLDWKPQYLPEGDGKVSIVSPDFSNPLGTTTGAYLHYSFFSPPEQFVGKPAQYMALLKLGMTWTETTLDGHPAFESKNANGYSMVVSQFSSSTFVTVAFSDTGKKYGSVFDEFIKSFHVH